MPGTVPSAEEFALAGLTGRRFAGRSRGFASREDAQQDAAVALLTVWPSLSARYPDGVPPAALVQAVRRRLIDELRTRSGWRQVVRPTAPVSIDAMFHHPADPKVDVEGEAITAADRRTDPDVETMIRRLAATGPVKKRRRYRTICRGLAAGKTQASIGAEVGVTESRISQQVKDIRRRAKYLRISP